MPAFSYTALQQLQTNIRKLYHERSKLGRLTLTHEEYIETFVPAEVRQMFRDIAPFVKAEDSHSRFTLCGPNHSVDAYLFLHSETPARYIPPVPRNLVIQGDAPPELVARIQDWLANGGDVSRDFGRVGRVLSVLNEHCSKQTMRYYWPSIIAICSMDDQTKGFASELQELRTPASPKPLPRGLSQACKLTAETIATAKLIPEGTEDPGFGDVTITIRSGQEYVEDGLGTFYGIG